MFRNPYHVHTIQSQLTRSLLACFGDVRDEIAQAFEDLIPAKADGKWTRLLQLSQCQDLPFIV